MTKNVFLFLTCAVAAFAHPMGNFSVSHYAKLQPSAKGVELEYVLDLAEIPTFEMLRDWNMERTAPEAELQSHAAVQAHLWLKNVDIALDGVTVHPKVESVNAVIADGAGNLPILRITTHAHIDARGGKLTYEDRNYAERAGWKEIVIDHGSGIVLRQASQTNQDVSKGLTQYPADPTVAPPQDLRAEMRWSTPVAPAPVVIASPKPVIQPLVQPHTAPAAPAPATLTAKNAPAGAVTRGDYLSRFLHERELTPWMIFLALGVAFVLGSAHAFTPGHGKTIVAAYLVGSRGTLKHAAFLGAMVTFTHTVVVFILGLLTLFLFNYVMPEKITEILGAISGLSIALIGAWMLYKRLHAGSAAQNQRVIHHHHGDGRYHTHNYGSHAHSHGGASHSHVPAEISWKGLVALGASGGLVPCESALVLLLGAIALGRVGLGLLLLLSFSLGLAIVLMAIGIAVLYAKNLIPESKRSSGHPLIRWAGIASPAVVLIIGIVMTAVSLGLIQPKWMIG
jgi:ABC-type nickel/cobalt efflux system permease component RcnA